MVIAEDIPDVTVWRSSRAEGLRFIEFWVSWCWYEDSGHRTRGFGFGSGSIMALVMRVACI